MGTPNMTLLQKADLALSELTSGGGVLQPQTAQTFLRLMIDESKLLKMATVYPMKAPKAEIPKIRFASRILRAGQEGTAVAQADRAKPSLTNVELDTKKFIAQVNLPDEVLEDNVEGEAFKNTIMQLVSEAIARDLDEIGVQGDTTSADLFLAQFNGVIKQASSNVVDAASANLNKGILRDMIKTMPKPFLRNKQDLRFLTSVDALIDYNDTLANRQTALGDKHLENGGQPQYSGITVDDIPLFPENVGTGSVCTHALLLDPKNMTWGVWRQIRMETDKDIEAGVVKIVCTLRVDLKYAEETAVVKANNVKVTS